MFNNVMLYSSVDNDVSNVSKSLVSILFLSNRVDILINERKLFNSSVFLISKLFVTFFDNNAIFE